MSLFHTLVSVAALISGGMIFFFIKGTKTHRKIGFTYVLSMALSLATSFFIYNMFDGFGAFHVMSFISIFTISIGMYFPILGRSVSGWPIHHYFWISYSYVGLLMAFLSHFIQYMPAGWPGVAKGFVSWGIPYILGSAVIFKNKQRIIETYSEMGAESETPAS